jgi:hypothetical protein
MPQVAMTICKKYEMVTCVMERYQCMLCAATLYYDAYTNTSQIEVCKRQVLRTHLL